MKFDKNCDSHIAILAIYSGFRHPKTHPPDRGIGCLNHTSFGVETRPFYPNLALGPRPAAMKAKTSKFGVNLPEFILCRLKNCPNLGSKTHFSLGGPRGTEILNGLILAKKCPFARNRGPPEGPGESNPWNLRVWGVIKRELPKLEKSALKFGG
jgi:hypothetical protein